MSMLLGCKCILLHIGGVYGDKEMATKRFVDNFNLLPQHLQDILCFENDDKSYCASEVLNICQSVKRPMVLDWHHNRCLPSGKPVSDYIEAIYATWSVSDLKPKVHLSTGKESKIDRRHAEYISIEDLYSCLSDTSYKFGIMLECKKKEQALFSLFNQIEILTTGSGS